MKEKVSAVIMFVLIAVCFCGCSQNEIKENKSQFENTFVSDIVKTESVSSSVSQSDNTNNQVTNNAKEKSGSVKNAGSLNGRIILIDAGHGKGDYSKKEPVAPGSSEMKAAFVAGTSGKNQTEAQLNLKVAKKLQAKLKAMGAQVHMTRMGESTTMSNADRAEMGNSLKADVTVRIHANGSDDKSVNGILTMIPGSKHVNQEIVEKSAAAGSAVQKHMVKQTGAKDGGLQTRDDLTGFNWSKVPTFLVEMGFMTNPEEDKKLESSDYQDKIVQGIADGLLEYFG